jgi:predicted flap endonuclease-1-like 5' DNA nuclease
MESLTPPIAPPVETVALELPASAGSDGDTGVTAQIITDASGPPVVRAATAPTPNVVDDLLLIAGLTPQDRDVLRKKGINSFKQVANWTASDVAKITALIGSPRRIARENWIEQAQLLALHGATAYTRKRRAELAQRPPSVAAEPQPNSSAAAAAAAAAAVAAGATLAGPQSLKPDASDEDMVAGFDTATVRKPLTAPVAITAGENSPSQLSKPEVAERAAFARPSRQYRDDLQEIDGINAEVEQLLNEQGISRFMQVAYLSDREQQRIDRLLGGMGRVKRENWIGQARELAGVAPATPGGDEDHAIGSTSSTHSAFPDDESSNIDAGVANSDYDIPRISPARAARGLRSVRSEALVGPTVFELQSHGDDLKRIRGVGVLIEKRLKAMGFSTYEQIGSWTSSDVDRVNQQLDFRGRIERENWIEQARILSSGGQTEFSRRHDRGE